MLPTQSRLRGPVGPNHFSRPEDILTLRRLMHGLGWFVGDVDTDFMDMGLNNSVMAYQQEKGLKPDGVVKPDGETEITLLRDWGALSRQSSLGRTVPSRAPATSRMPQRLMEQGDSSRQVTPAQTVFSEPQENSPAPETRESSPVERAVEPLQTLSKAWNSRKRRRQRLKGRWT